MDQHKSKIKWTVFGLLLGLLMAALDQTIVATAMPTVVGEMGGYEQFVWVFSAYMIASVVATPIFGKLSDIYGRKIFFLIGIVVFLIGSILCGAASSMTQLIVFRAVQGIGGGALMPIAFAVIFDIFPPEKRGKMNGLFGAVFGLSSVFGPAIGAFFTDYVNWRWVFYINVPLGAIALAAIGFGYHESANRRKQRIDWIGAAALIAAILCLMFAVELGGSSVYAWGSPQIIGLLIGFAVMLTAFLLIERVAPDPIVELKLFRNRIFAASQFIAFIYGAIMIAGATYIPLFIQGVYGESASAAGQTLTPMMLAVVCSSMVGGRFVNHVSYRTLMLISVSVLAIALILLSTMTLDTPRWVVTLYMIFVGLGIGVNFVVLNISVLHGIDNTYKGAAISLITFFRTIGSAIGVTVMGAIQKMTFKDDMAAVFPNPADAAQFADPQNLLRPELRQGLSEQVLTQATSSLADSIAFLFLMALLMIAVAFILILMLGRARVKLPDRSAESQQEPASAH